MAFFAPSLDDLGPVVEVVEPERRDVAEGRVMGVPLSAEEVTVLGPVVLAPMEGGAEGAFAVEGVGLAGAGLSHVSKKSSVDAEGVLEARGVSSSPSIWIPLGFLLVSQKARYCLTRMGMGFTSMHPQRFVERALLCRAQLVGKYI